MATFISALQDPALGVAIAIAIAIHNIPEGIAVSVPIYYATKNRKKAFKLSFFVRVGRTDWCACRFSHFNAFSRRYCLWHHFCSCGGNHGFYLT